MVPDSNLEVGDLVVHHTNKKSLDGVLGQSCPESDGVANSCSPASLGQFPELKIEVRSLGRHNRLQDMAGFNVFLFEQSEENKENQIQN